MKTISFSTLVLSLTYATGIVDALVTRTIHERAKTDPVGHGNYGNFEDEIWRYQEISDGLFVGVKPEEWNDSIHKRGVLPPEVHDLRSRATTTEVEDLLLQRDLIDQCNVGMRCAYRKAEKTAISMRKGAGVLLTKIKETYGPNFWGFLQKPFMANLAGVGLQNVIVTASFRGAGNGGGIKQCSTTGTDADAFLEMLKLVDNKDLNISAMKMEITTPNGQRGIVSIAIVEDGHNPPMLCGAPPG
ncbi:hypothetical protein EMPG_10402 [Blastomyces silverae]|uniref:Uncharacterized protein n=1 Tax=Blastomyces silverae TaxID=2060906 RepID=A0A0H1B517_9EURO|nr:hypothetical protein EMPG_10402 [Blastomyces silverae]